MKRGNPVLTCACVRVSSAGCGLAGSPPGPSSCRCSSPCPERQREKGRERELTRCWHFTTSLAAVRPGGGNKMWVSELEKAVRKPVAHERLTLRRALVISCLIQRPLPLRAGDRRVYALLFFLMKRCREFTTIFYLVQPSAHLRVACHDGVVAVIIQWGCGGVQGAGPVSVAADPVVLAPLGDLLAIFEPVDLGHATRQIKQ